MRDFQQIGSADLARSGRLLYFGGSFNPVHNAHLACSATAARIGGFNTVTLVPTRQPLLKDADYTLASAADRLAMLELAVRSMPSEPRFQIDPIELHRTGPSYTFDTVSELRAAGASEVHWLIGADQLVNFHRWHRFEDLIRLAQFWVMARPGYVIDWDAVNPAVRQLADHVLTVPQMNISATAIRHRVAAGESIDEFVPADVREYIRAQKLYIPRG